MNSKNESRCILDSIQRLEQYVRSEKYSGYDPYDALNSEKIGSTKSKFLKLTATQIFVYSPINPRNFFNTTPGRNPKALGLFLQAYCKLLKTKIVEKNQFEQITKDLSDYLIQHHSTGYSGYCWGYNFDWQDLTRYAKRGIPTIVVTSYIGHALLDLYDIKKDKQYLDIAKSSCQFILNDLNIRKTKTGICFSYTPIDNHIIHNANMLGAAFLARVYSITNDTNLLDHSKKAIDFSLSQQKDDGSWAYSKNPETGKERNQIDYHQGFNLDALCDILKYLKPSDKKYKNTVEKGAAFYQQNQFGVNGPSAWRYPKRWPKDIHHQAQGILTFSKLYEILKNKDYLDFSKKIALWTIHHMQDSKGYFYYQKWPIGTNKISYMRWGQAWMLLALSEYIHQSQSRELMR